MIAPGRSAGTRTTITGPAIEKDRKCNVEAILTGDTSGEVGSRRNLKNRARAACVERTASGAIENFLKSAAITPWS